MNIMMLSILVINLQSWSLFENVTFESTYHEELDTYVDIPSFGKMLQYYDGKSIAIKGHYLPLELIDTKSIILSKNPYSSCFFCGGAGLESVIEVHFAEEPRHIDADERITISGTLKLNNDDFEHLVFILENAKEIK